MILQVDMHGILLCDNQLPNNQYDITCSYNHLTIKMSRNCSLIVFVEKEAAHSIVRLGRGSADRPTSAEDFASAVKN